MHSDKDTSMNSQPALGTGASNEGHTSGPDVLQDIPKSDDVLKVLVSGCPIWHATPKTHVNPAEKIEELADQLDLVVSAASFLGQFPISRIVGREPLSMESKSSGKPLTSVEDE